MQRLQELIKEINDLTLKIEQEYPELYQYLDETPITIPCCNHLKVDTKNFSDYLDSLKQLLEHHIENHQKQKS
ncbi:MAG: hypothetical protein AB7O47_13135 [Flavobacteriales bacterium]